MKTIRRPFLALLPVLWVAAFIALPTGADAAKLARPPVPGERVRVGLTDGSGPLTGTLLASRIDALDLALEPDSARRTIPGEIIAGLEVERRHGHAVTGAAVGFLVGGLGMLGATAILTSKENEGVAPGGILVGGGLIGMTLGALIGEGITSRRWDAARRP